MKTIITDGGRSTSGIAGKARGDCVVRAVAIATGLPYAQVYADLAWGHMKQRRSKHAMQRGRTYKHTADDGINVNRAWFKRYMESRGWRWTPTMGIGTGCTVHLKADELPMGRLIVSVSKHMVAVIDRVIFDLHDPSRGGTRCVYGYWSR